MQTITANKTLCDIKVMSADLPLTKLMDFAYGRADEVAPEVHRLVARNPSPYTFKGTNTYLVGDKQLAVVDPGPLLDEHLDDICRAAGDRQITHIFLTHRHHDHVEGLAALQEATGARSYAFAAVAGAVDGENSETLGSGQSKDVFEPDVILRDGDVVEGHGWVIAALHTPGHAPDHLAFEVLGTGILFCGDHVMGWNTTVVAPPGGHMGDYFSSLEKLIQRDHDKLYLPGHGDVIRKPQRVARAFLTHRKVREAAVISGLRDGRSSISDLTAGIYVGLDDALVPAAQLSVRAHVDWLVERGIARPCACSGPNACFELVSE